MARSRANVFFALLLILATGCHHNAPSSNQPPPDIGQLALSDIALFFTANVGQASRAQTVTLTNMGSTTLLLSSITLSDTTNFAMTSNCGASLVAPASCTLTITFKPQSTSQAAAGFSASILIADNTASSPKTININGTGTTGAAAAAAQAAPTPSASVTYTLYTFPQPDKSATPLYALITAAQKSIDMTMYALEDTTFTTDLLAACKRNVMVRVILDQNLEKSGNTPAFTQLNSQPNCSAVWANKAFQATHEKSIVIDGTQAAIMSLNLQPQYYTTTRDFALLENDAADVAAVQATFNADFAAGTTATGTSGASDFTYAPGPGDHLIWSPTTAQSSMVNLIAFAQKTLLIENEELATSATAILSALETACKKGVQVHIAMVNNTSYATSFAAVTKAGCSLHTYPNTTTGFYIHAKAVVADYGLPTQNAYVGSINYSNASMNSNRELGMFVTDASTITSLHDTMLADYNGGTPYPTK